MITTVFDKTFVLNNKTKNPEKIKTDIYLSEFSHFGLVYSCFGDTIMYIVRACGLEFWITILLSSSVAVQYRGSNIHDPCAVIRYGHIFMSCVNT